MAHSRKGGSSRRLEEDDNERTESTLDLDELKEGARLWRLGGVRPSGDNEAGRICTVKNESRRRNELARPLFTKCAFSPRGDELVTIDEVGNVFAFRILGGHVSLVRRLGSKGHAVAFSPNLPREVLVSLENKKSIVFDIDSPSQDQSDTKTLSGHRHPVHSISFHPSWNVVALASVDRLTLWDTTTWENTKKLGGGSGIVDTKFTPRGDLLLVAFNNSEIFGWGASSFELLVRLVPKLPANHPRYQHHRNSDACNITCFTVSPDSRFVVAGGKGCLLFVWELRARTLIRVVELPESVTSVSQVEFMSDNFSVAVLSDDGVIRIIQVVGGATTKILQEFGKDTGAYLSFAVSFPDCNTLAGCLSDGTLTLHDLDAAKSHAMRVKQARTRMGLHADSERGFLTNYAVFHPSGLELPQSENPSPHDHERRTDPKMSLAAVVEEDDNENNMPDEYHEEDNKQNPKLRRTQTSPIRDTSSPIEKTKQNFHSVRMEFPELGPNLGKRLVENFTEDGPDDSSPPLVRLARNLTQEDTRFNLERLQKHVQHFGELPSKYRLLVWRFLLQLPENASAYGNLVRKGGHPSWSNLYEKFPVKSPQLFSRFERVMFALAHWCPLFQQVSYLPAIIFPFVKIFGMDELAAFESVMTVLFRICSSWFETFPHLPLFSLARLEKLLDRVDGAVLRHFTEREVTSEVYAWPMLKSLFSEVLSKEEWLKLWDNLLVRLDMADQLIEAACIAYIRYFRNTLLSLRRKEDFEAFFRRQNALDSRRFIKATLRLHRQHLSFWEKFSDAKIGKESSSSKRQQLPQGRLPRGESYPAFTRYPTFHVDFEAAERRRIKHEEDELLRKQRYANEIRESTLSLEEKEAQHIKFQDYLLQVESENRKKQVEMEETRLRELERVNRVTRMRRLERIDKLEQLAHENLALQDRFRKAEVVRQQNDLEHRMKMFGVELSDKEEEEKVHGLETQAYLKLQRLHTQREIEQEMQAVRNQVELLSKEAELEWKLKEEALKSEEEKRKLEREMYLEQADTNARIKQVHGTRRELERNFLAQQVEAQAKIADLERKRQLRHFAEDASVLAQEKFEKRLELERLVAEKEGLHRDAMNRQFDEWAKKLTAEREQILTDEKRMFLKEAQSRDQRLAALEQLQARRKFEEETSKAFRKNREKIDEEEKELHRQLLQLDEQRRTERMVEEELLRREQEIEDRIEFLRASRKAEEDAMRAERERFDELRLELERIRQEEEQGGIRQEKGYGRRSHEGPNDALKLASEARRKARLSEAEKFATE